MATCLFLQSLMRNYDVSALLCVSDTAPTVRIPRIKIYLHVSDVHSAQNFMVIL